MATKTKYPNGYKPKIEYHTQQAKKWDDKAILELEKNMASPTLSSAVWYEDYVARRDQALESVAYFTKRQNELDS